MNLSSFFLLFWQNTKEINCASVSTEKKKDLNKKKKQKKRENVLVRYVKSDDVSIHVLCILFWNCFYIQ